MPGFCDSFQSKTKWTDIDGDGLVDITCNDFYGNNAIFLNKNNKSFSDLGKKTSMVKFGRRLFDNFCSNGNQQIFWADMNGDK